MQIKPLVCGLLECHWNGSHGDVSEAIFSVFWMCRIGTSMVSVYWMVCGKRDCRGVSERSGICCWVRYESVGDGVSG